jgi:hypothetical protein
VYRLPRAERPSRPAPPAPSGGEETIAGAGDAAPLDGAMVARERLQDVSFRSSLVVVGVVDSQRRRKERATPRLPFGALLRRWFALPVFRFASCGAAAAIALAVYAGASSSVTAGVAQAKAETTDGQTQSALTVVKHRLAERSAVALADDFASGLHDWEGGENWSARWAYDQSGGVKPGALALLRPSMGLKDYRLEFLGQIENKALGFTVRSADIKNYYAVKLVVRTPGPVPVISILRYAVIDGKESNRFEKRLPVTVYNDTIYRIRLTAREDTFTFSVNDQVVDSWSDDRLPEGGIGFFSGEDERARIYDVRLAHQDDTIGKMIAFVANNQPGTDQGIVKQ